MKHILLFLSTILCSFFTAAQLSGAGDLAFIAFNADANDDFAIVTFKDIPANSSVFFSDQPWDGTMLADNEARFEWQTGNAVIPQGTVIVFNNISDASRTVTFGNYVGSPGGLSATSEAIFAYTGPDVDTPMTFLAAVANSSGGYGTLEGTGLIENLTAITYPSSTDIGVYNGTRSGLDTGGFMAQLNNRDNYDFQSGSGDQSADGMTPDLPFDTTAFQISMTDTTAPFIAAVEVVDMNNLNVIISEELDVASATNVANYTINNGITVSSVDYDAGATTIRIRHSGFELGVEYRVSITNLEDTSSNVQSGTFQSEPLFFNDTSSGLIISEIMYNAPGSTDDDDLEFVEIYNNGASTITLGGLKFIEESGIVFTFPQMDLPVASTVLVATNKTFADAFYGQVFLDMALSQTNVFGNGGELLRIENSQNIEIFSVDYDDNSATGWPTTPDGDGPSLELRDPSIDVNMGSNWMAATNLIGQSESSDIFASPGVYSPVTTNQPSISFEDSFINVNENNGTAVITVTIDRAPTANVTANIQLAAGSTATMDNVSLSSNMVTFIPGGDLSQAITITINDNNTADADVFAAFEITNLTGATEGSNPTQVIYIIDDESDVPVGANLLNMSLLTSYAITGSSPSAEIVAHDPASQQLFVLNNGAGTIEILDFSNPSNIVPVSTIDLGINTIGVNAGDVVEGTSVTSNNGVIAAVSYRVEDGAGNELFEPGTLAFYNAADGSFISAVSVGILPDMVTFTPDGLKVLIANEGQPSEDYTTDPEGTISVVDVSDGAAAVTQADVVTINFNAFDSQINTLRSQQVRIFGPNATVSQDFEPEFITVSSDSQKAYVSLQENNAMAVLDLTNNTIIDIFSYGLKDHNLAGNTLDVNNNLNFIFQANWPVKGMYMPDAIATYSVNGVNYVVTSNEGDARDYDGFSEELRVGDSDYILDPVVFPNADLLKRAGNLDRINTTNATGDLDGDGDFDEIHVYGARSFSIFNADTGEIVYDSGDDFEIITAADPVYGSIFNASNSNNNFKNRSDDKGPEPEGVVVQEINGSTYAFIGLERVGGLMVYDISDPTAPVFENYVNNRSAVEGGNESGDLGPEGIIYIDATDNSNATGLVVVANEVSASLSVYQVTAATASVNDVVSDVSLRLFPNPVTAGERLFFNSPQDFQVYDLNGRLLREGAQSTHINTTGLSTGMYLVRASGKSAKILVQ